MRDRVIVPIVSYSIVAIVIGVFAIGGFPKFSGTSQVREVDSRVAALSREYGLLTSDAMRLAADQENIQEKISILGDQTSQLEEDIQSVAGLHARNRRELATTLTLQNQIGSTASESQTRALQQTVSVLKESIAALQNHTVERVDTLKAVALQQSSGILKAEEAALPQAPLYNISIEGTSGGHLVNGTKTSVSFFIAQPHIGAPVPFPQWTSSPSVLNESGMLPFTVTMHCLGCSTGAVQAKVVTYSLASGASSEARFDFVPDLRSTPADTQNLLVFDVQSDGIWYDHLLVNLSNISNDAATTSAGAAQTVRLTTPSKPAGSLKADIVFEIYRDKGTLQVAIQPIHPALVAKFPSSHMGDAGFIPFAVSVLDDTDVKQEERDFYAALRKATDESKLADTSKINETFVNLGRHLHTKLFEAAIVDSDLQAFIDSFENIEIPGYHFRVQINSSDVKLPWQLLNFSSSGDDDLRKFWGFRYELSVMPFLPTVNGTLPSVMEYDSKSSAIFAAYPHSSNVPAIADPNPVVRFANEEYGVVKDSMQGGVPIYVESKQDLLNNLTSNSGSIKLVFAYTHAGSGMGAATVPPAMNAGSDQPIIYVPDGRGPRLLFGTGSTDEVMVFPKDIFDLLEKRKTKKELLFSGRPIALLNACETGLGSLSIDSGDYSGTADGFPENLLQSGFRGVIATQSRVFAESARDFGDDLIRQIFTDTDIPHALFVSRWNYYDKTKTTLGLLYSYYGNPDANVKLTVPPKQQISAVGRQTHENSASVAKH